MMRFFAAFLLIGGISLAGSDGPLFPWLNLFGVGLIWTVALMLRRLPLEEN